MHRGNRSNKGLVSVAGAIVASCLVAGQAPAQSAESSEAAIVRDVAAIVEDMAANDRFSGVAILAKDGKVLLERAHGLEDRAAKTPITINTKFNLGSLNKLFTGVAIAQLVQDGKLKFTDTIERWVPELKEASKITIHQLLTHSSGLGNYLGENSPALKGVETTLDYFRLVEGGKRTFEPGTGFAYSNSGFIVLGLIIERVTGMDYHEYTRKFIFEPAGMIDTSAYRVTEIGPGIAKGYTKLNPFGTSTPGELSDNTGTLPRRGGPAGGGYSTAPDLLRFASALLQNKLLNEKITSTVLSVQSSDPALNPPGLPGPSRGYPFLVGNIRGQRVARHAGGAPGISDEVFLFLDSGYVLIGLTNSDPPAVGELGHRALAAILGS